MSQDNDSECAQKFWWNTTFEKHRDLYRGIASEIYRVPIDEVTQEQRALVKERYWFWLYAAGPEKLQVAHDDDLRKTLDNAFRRLSEGLARDVHGQGQEEVPAVSKTP